MADQITKRLIEKRFELWAVDQGLKRGTFDATARKAVVDAVGLDWLNSRVELYQIVNEGGGQRTIASRRTKAEMLAWFEGAEWAHEASRKAYVATVRELGESKSK